MAVARAFGAVPLSGELFGSVKDNLREVGRALIPSGVVGVILGALMGHFGVFEWATDIYVGEL